MVGAARGRGSRSRWGRANFGKAGVAIGLLAANVNLKMAVSRYARGRFSSCAPCPGLISKLAMSQNLGSRRRTPGLDLHAGLNVAKRSQLRERRWPPQIHVEDNR